MVSDVINYYNTYDEDGRLFRDHSHQIEWLTTMHYFHEMLPANSRIFDGCAGTGNYAFNLAEQGHKVVASDLVPHNVEVMLKKTGGHADVGGYLCRRSLRPQSL